MILALMSAYPYRKQYTKSFLEFTFFVIYYLHFILSLKLINEIIVKIEFIQDLMNEYKNSNIVKANDLLFGNVELQKANSASGDYINIAYMLWLLVCFNLIQSWKQAKWIEIRYKTREMQGMSYFKRFGAYIKNRD
jgi:hypothetical protein